MFDKEFLVMMGAGLVVVILGALVYDLLISDAVTRAKSKPELE